MLVISQVLAGCAWIDGLGKDVSDPFYSPDLLTESATIVRIDSGVRDSADTGLPFEPPTKWTVDTGTTEDGCKQLLFHVDNDGDGHGDPQATILSCPCLLYTSDAADE